MFHLTVLCHEIIRGEKRMVVIDSFFNLKYLEKSIEKVRFKMDSLKAAISLLKKDCYFAPLDTTRDYIVIQISEIH